MRVGRFDGGAGVTRDPDVTSGGRRNIQQNVGTTGSELPEPFSCRQRDRGGGRPFRNHGLVDRIIGRRCG